MNIINALKENEKPFGLMSEEMQAKAREIGWCGNFRIFNGDSFGGIIGTPDYELEEELTYQLRSDYKENLERKNEMNEREILEQSIKDHLEAINKANAGLEALNKPKLRHGDYGFTEDGYARITVEVVGKNGLSQSGCAYLPEDGCSNRMDTNVFGNIFDDLEELKKPLEKFEVTDDRNDAVNVKFSKTGSEKKEICIDGRAVYLSIDEAKDFSMKLRRVILTAERN